MIPGVETTNLINVSTIVALLEHSLLAAAKSGSALWAIRRWDKSPILRLY
jgi:hypothetical protein